MKILDLKIMFLVSYHFSILSWYKQLKKIIKMRCLHLLNEGLGTQYNSASADPNFRDLVLEYIYTGINLKVASVWWYMIL